VISPTPSELSSVLSSTSNTIDNSQPASPSWSDATPEIFLTPPRESIQINSKLTNPSPLAKYIKMEQSCNTPECEVLRQLLSDREKDLQHLRGKLAEAQLANDELHIKMLSQANSAAICGNRAKTPTQENLRRYLDEIERLKFQKLDKEELVPFTTRNITKHMPFDQGIFKTHMSDIKYRIDDFMCLYSEVSRPCNEIKRRDMPDDLRSLLFRATGESKDALQSISFHALLRSILSAAVCEWVLECEVQEPMIKGCPLCDTMLSHLSLMGK
jgi:hypothetical protein